MIAHHSVLNRQFAQKIHIVIIALSSFFIIALNYFLLIFSLPIVLNPINFPLRISIVENSLDFLLVRISKLSKVSNQSEIKFIQHTIVAIIIIFFYPFLVVLIHDCEMLLTNFLYKIKVKIKMSKKGQYLNQEPIYDLIEYNVVSAD